MFQSDESIGTRPVPAHILDACKPLVEERRNSTLAFIHTSVKDYLQSDDCNRSIWMEKKSIRWEHSLASLRCLLAAFNVFNPHFPQNDRQMQVVRGVWGFLPFATESWAVDLQELTAAPAKDWHPRLDGIASELATLLATSRPDPDATPTGRLIEGLEPIRSCFPGLWYDVTLNLEARVSGQHQVAASHPEDKFVHPTRVHHIFENYEATVRHVVETQDRSNVTSSDFQLFCTNFSGHAYLCRFISCAHATSGFNSNEERRIHESGHTLSFPCPEPGCQYPPFGSHSAMRRHLSKTHEKEGRKRPAVRPISNTFSKAGRSSPLKRSRTPPRFHEMPNLTTEQPVSNGEYSLANSYSEMHPSNEVLSDFDFDSFLHDGSSFGFPPSNEVLSDFDFDSFLHDRSSFGFPPRLDKQDQLQGIFNRTSEVANLEAVFESPMTPTPPPGPSITQDTTVGRGRRQTADSLYSFDSYGDPPIQPPTGVAAPVKTALPLGPLSRMVEEKAKSDPELHALMERVVMLDATKDEHDRFQGIVNRVIELSNLEHFFDPPMGPSPPTQPLGPRAAQEPDVGEGRRQIEDDLSGGRGFNASDYDPGPPREPRAEQESIAGEEEPFTVKCICAFPYYDGNMILCELCEAETWQHIECYYPDHVEDASLPDFAHSCVDCEPRTLDRQRAIARMGLRRLTASFEPAMTVMTPSPRRGPSTIQETTAGEGQQQTATSPLSVNTSTRPSTPAMMATALAKTTLYRSPRDNRQNGRKGYLGGTPAPRPDGTRGER